MTDAETLRSIVEKAWSESHDVEAVIGAVAAVLSERSMRSVKAEAIRLAIRTECREITHLTRAAVHAASAPEPKPTQRGPDVIGRVQGGMDYSYLRDYRICVPERGSVGLGDCTPEEVMPAREHMESQAKGCLLEATFLGAVVAAGKPGKLLKKTLTDESIAKLYAEAKKRCK